MTVTLLCICPLCGTNTNIHVGHWCDLDFLTLFLALRPAKIYDITEAIRLVSSGSVLVYNQHHCALFATFASCLELEQ